MAKGVILALEHLEECILSVSPNVMRVLGPFDLARRRPVYSGTGEGMSTWRPVNSSKRSNARPLDEQVVGPPKGFWIKSIPPSSPETWAKYYYESNNPEIWNFNIRARIF